MILKTILLGLIFAVSTLIQAQQPTFIGLTKDEVKERLKEHHRHFSPDKSVINQTYNYLKYVNGSETITWIIYFTDDDICKATKKVCDYAEYDFILEDLNENYEKVNDGLWEYSEDGRQFTLALTEEDWYFTLREREKNNKK